MPKRPTFHKTAPAPKSQAEHNAEAIDNIIPMDPAPAADDKQVLTPQKATKPRKQGQSRGTRPSAAPAGTRPVSLYLPVPVREAARSAYVLQFAGDNPVRETSFSRWMGAVMDRFAAMTKEQRHAAVRDMPQEWGEHITRTYQIPRSAYERAETARKDMAGWIAPDGTTSAHSMSEWVTQALWVATEQVKAQRGGELPPVTGRLPSLPA